MMTMTMTMMTTMMMMSATSGNSGNAPIEGEFQRLHQQAESVDAERDRYDSPEPQPQPEVQPTDHDARIAAVWFCRWVAVTATKFWPMLSYTDEAIEHGGGVLAPLVKKYAAASMPVMQLFARWEHELAALWFFGIIIGESIDRVRTTRKSDHTNQVPHGPQATTTSEDGEALNTGTVWQQEAPRTDARPGAG